MLWFVKYTLLQNQFKNMASIYWLIETNSFVIWIFDIIYNCFGETQRKGQQGWVSDGYICNLAAHLRASHGSSLLLTGCAS